MAQAVKKLILEASGLEFDSQNSCKKWLHMVTCAYNPGVTEAEIGRCLGLTGLPAQSIWRSSRATRNFNNQQTYIYIYIKKVI